MTETMTAETGAAAAYRAGRRGGARHGGGDTLCTDSAHRADLISHAGLPRLRGLHVVAQTQRAH